MRTSPVGLLALVTGFAVTFIGLGVYQAWWTIAFSIAGFVVALQTEHTSASRSLAIGLLVGGAILLGGMSLFLLYASGFGGAPWLAAAIASAALAVALFLVAWRLRTSRSDDVSIGG